MIPSAIPFAVDSRICNVVVDPIKATVFTIVTVQHNFHVSRGMQTYFIIRKTLGRMEIEHEQ